MPETTDSLTFSRERNVSSAFIDSSTKLGIAQAVLMVQDNLTECFAALGCDGITWRERFGVFWVFTKTRIDFFRRPCWRDRIAVRTFPVANAGFRAEVNTVLSDLDGNVLAAANQEACVLDLEKRRPVKLAALPFPAGPFPARACESPFGKFPQDFSEDEFAFEQAVRSQHIDMSRHMNNIEYIRLALSVFSDDFLQTHEPKSLEVHYTGESREGQLLRVFSRTDGGTTFVGIREGGRQVFEMRAEF